MSDLLETHVHWRRYNNALPGRYVIGVKSPMCIYASWLQRQISAARRIIFWWRPRLGSEDARRINFEVPWFVAHQDIVSIPSVGKTFWVEWRRSSCTLWGVFFFLRFAVILPLQDWLTAEAAEGRLLWETVSVKDTYIACLRVVSTISLDPIPDICLSIFLLHKLTAKDISTKLAELLFCKFLVSIRLPQLREQTLEVYVRFTNENIVRPVQALKSESYLG
jgi:hypothetical protein